MKKLNKTFETPYKNAVIEIVVEDDTITTSRVFIDEKCVCYSEIKTDKNPDGVPFTRENYNQVLDMCKSDVNRLFDELLEKLGAKATSVAV